MKIIRTIAARVPRTINGVLLPYLDLQLSLILPKSGSMNSASKLSRPMIRPRIAFERPNALSMSRGIT